ncbi:respiratory nitrate reductase subunit gamma, partial [Pseudoclavibacter sp. RFBA6]|uniref:respiratory nitrate reductase subunit gamma n=1 Tax=Pseudoclavibacter sp. RFBA6 TaxID=2080573 RepID=UPI000D4D94FA
PTPTPTTVPGKPSQPESLATTGAEQAAIGGGILLGIAALVGGAVLVTKRRKNAEGEATNES